MNQLKSINDIVEFLINNGIKLKPLGYAEISVIEEKFDVCLPETYKQFLRIMGKGAGDFMLGSSVFYDELFDLREGTDELIIDNGLEPLPKEAFVFYMHQGYQAGYFMLNESQDPPVYYYSESKQGSKFELKTNSLTDFFIAQLALSGFKLP